MNAKQLYCLVLLGLATILGRSVVAAELPKQEPTQESFCEAERKIAVSEVLVVSDGVYPYLDAHEEAIARIALDNLSKLVSITKYTPEEYQRLLEREIIHSLRNSGKGVTTTKTYIHNEKPVGFITYGISNPWHRILVPQEVGPNAKIYHLAVDATARGKGYGSLLVKDVLSDLRDKSVNRVTLWTTTPSSDLRKFYATFGFKSARITKMKEEQYALRLKPHPALVLARAGLTLLKRK